MYFEVTREQEMLRDAARAYLSDKVPLARVRELMETPDAFDRDVWFQMADMGWHAIAIPEDYGGAGFSFQELGILLEEMGRMLTPLPFFSSVVLGAGALLVAGDEEQRRSYLPPIASGEQRVALAVAEAGTGWEPESWATRADRRPGGLRLTGKKSFVIDGHTADFLVVSALSNEGETDLFLVDATADGVSSRRLETMDMTRKQAAIEFDDVEPIAQLGGPGGGRAALERLYDIAVTMLAHEQLGGAQRCMEMSVDHAKERVQFGRPIGSFQAVKHKCADMLVDVEDARSTAQYAGRALALGDDDLSVAAPLAKVRCSEAYRRVAAETIQVHGGIGFTWEHDAHLYFKRAKTDELLFGTPADWRLKLADRLGL